MWISSPCVCCRSAAYLAGLVAVSIMDAGVSATSFYEVTIAPVTENASISKCTATLESRRRSRMTGRGI
jgi:hypothetical protein